MEYPKSRSEAKATGAKYYFTGQPCSRGHVALRKTKGVCVECMKEDWATENARRSLLPGRRLMLAGPLGDLSSVGSGGVKVLPASVERKPNCVP